MKSRNEDLLHVVLTIVVLAVISLGIVAFGSHARADLYVAAEGGASSHACGSNDCETEFGREPGANFRLSVGQPFEVGPFILKTEVFAGILTGTLHGKNGFGCSQESCSADHMDDNTLTLTDAGVALWPTFEAGGYAISLGGGLSAGTVDALGDTEFAATGFAGASVTKKIGDYRVGFGYRYTRGLHQPNVSRQNTRVESHGIVFRVEF